MTSPAMQPVPADRWVTVPNPADPTAPAIYEGDYQQAHTALAPGEYRAEGTGPAGDTRQVLLTVDGGVTSRQPVQLDMTGPTTTADAAQPERARQRLLDPPGVRVTIRGRLTADPELGYSDAGKPYLRMPLASNERIFRNGEWENGPVQYSQGVLFGNRAEAVFNQQPPLAKGDEIIVHGRLELDVFTRRDGAPGAALKVMATTVDRVPDRAGRKTTATVAPAVATSPRAEVRHSPEGTAVTGVERGDRQLQGALKQAGFKWTPATSAWELPAAMPAQERWGKVQAFGQTLQSAQRPLPPIVTAPGTTTAAVAAPRTASPAPVM